MKYLLAIIVIVTAAATPALTQGWERVYPETEVNDLQDVIWWNGDTAFACGMNWTLLRTTDAGDTWDRVFHNGQLDPIQRLARNSQYVYFGGGFHQWRDPFSEKDIFRVFQYDPRSGALDTLVIPDEYQPWSVLNYPPLFATDRFLFVTNPVVRQYLWRYDLQTEEWKLFELDWFQTEMEIVNDSLYCYTTLSKDYNDRKHFIRTTDAGQTWSMDTVFTPRSGILEHTLTSVSDGHGVRFLMTTNMGVLVSDDTGRTWSEAEQIPWRSFNTFMLTDIDAVTRDHWYATGFESDLYETRDGGQTWLLLKPADRSLDTFERFAENLAVRSDGAMLLVTDPGTIHQSLNGGITWEERLGSDIDYWYKLHFFSEMEGVAIARSGAGQWYMFESRDGGASWERTGEFPYAGWAELRSVDEIYAYDISYDSTEVYSFSLLRSTDRGTSWDEQHTTEVGSRVSQFFRCGDVYLLSTGWKTEPGGVFQSTDMGASWNFCHISAEDFTAGDVQCGVSKSGERVFYLIPAGLGRPVIYYSTDDGCTWNPRYSPDPTASSGFDELDVLSADTLILRLDTRVFVTTDGCMSWTEFAAPVPQGNYVRDFVYLWPNILRLRASYEISSTADWWQTSRIEVRKETRYPSLSPWYFLDQHTGWAALGREIWRTSTGGVNWVRTAPDASEGFGISSVYPNPVTAGTSVSIDIHLPPQSPLAEGGRRNPVRVSVYDLLGREVAVLFEGRGNGANSTFIWHTAALNPGTYYITVVSRSKRSVRPIAVVR